MGKKSSPFDGAGAAPNMAKSMNGRAATVFAARQALNAVSPDARPRSGHATTPKAGNEERSPGHLDRVRHRHSRDLRRQYVGYWAKDRSPATFQRALVIPQAPRKRSHRAHHAGVSDSATSGAQSELTHCTTGRVDHRQFPCRLLGFATTALPSATTASALPPIGDA